MWEVIVIAKPLSITKETVDRTAFDIIRTEGMDALTARYIAEKAGCSTQPIYKIYRNLDELKENALQAVFDYMNDIIFGYDKTHIPFLNAGLGFIYFAGAERVLFRVFHIENYLKLPVFSPLSDSYLYGLMEQLLKQSPLSAGERQEVFINTMIYTNGLAQLNFSGQLGMSEQQVAERLMEFFYRFSGVKCEVEANSAACEGEESL